MISIVTGVAVFFVFNFVYFFIKKNHYVKIIDDLSTGQYSNIKHLPKSSYTFYKLDLSKRTKKLKRILKNASYVFHLAGKADIVPSIENPINYFDSVYGTLHL